MERPLNYGPETLAAMEHVGLLSRGSSIATPDAIDLMIYNEAKATMVDFGLKGSPPRLLKTAL